MIEKKYPRLCVKKTRTLGRRHRSRWYVRVHYFFGHRGNTIFRGNSFEEALAKAFRHINGKV